MNNNTLLDLKDWSQKSNWANRYSTRLVKLSDRVFSKMKSLEWDSEEYQSLRGLRNRIAIKIYVLARYSGFITGNAVKLLKSN